MSSAPATRAEAEALDAADPLREARAAFVLTDGVTYLDGHSLGPATHGAQARIADAVARGWSQRLIRSWNDAGDGAGWIDLPSRVGARIARLIGVAPDEVIVADSVSMNLFKLAGAALDICATRAVIVEGDEFPTDQYMAEGLCALADARFIRTPPGGGGGALVETGGVLVKSVVSYRSAAVADIAALEAAARARGGAVVWDLSHATGVLDVALARHGARLAAGCTYKYLNGGPGAPAFVHVCGDVADRLRNPLSGWMGHAAPFDFAAPYAPAGGVLRFAAGTPPVLSLAALDGALDALDGVDVARLEAKARLLGDICLARAEAMGLESISPPAGRRRGGHVSLRHENGYAVVQALIAAGVIADFRAPDLMRFGFSPLYVRHVDVWDAMDRLERILETRAWDVEAFYRRAAVT